MKKIILFIFSFALLILLFSCSKQEKKEDLYLEYGSLSDGVCYYNGEYYNIKEIYENLESKNIIVIDYVANKKVDKYYYNFEAIKNIKDEEIYIYSCSYGDNEFFSFSCINFIHNIDNNTYRVEYYFKRITI